MFDQNNSGGRFVVDNNVCHRVVIEANSEKETIRKAEDLGCYWNGVDKDIDCPCCGDRWYDSPDEIDIEKYSNEGYTAGVYDGIYQNTKVEWDERYRKYEVVEEPHFEQRFSSREYVGKIKFHNIEEYIQYLADEYGWTTPDARIFYQNGIITEVFSSKVK
jgi:hypothetical protein